VPSDTPDSPSQRIAEAAALLPPYAALGGWAAAYWMGVRFLDGMRGGDATPVLLNIGDGTGHIRKAPGVTVLRTRITAEELVRVRGFQVTTPVRTAFDGARLAPTLVEAVIFVDMMLASGLVTVDELAAYLPEHRAAWKGVAQARRALALADPATKSPPETRLRLLWTLEAGLPRPLVNRPVFTLDGHLIGFPDILDPMSATVGEYDGDQHRELAQHTADNAREEDFEDHGLVVTRVTRMDLQRDQRTVQRLNRAWQRGMARDRRLDRWTLTPPAWYLNRASRSA
jgi:hypothetical protein